MNVRNYKKNLKYRYNDSEKYMRIRHGMHFVPDLQIRKHHNGTMIAAHDCGAHCIFDNLWHQTFRCNEIV